MGQVFKARQALMGRVVALKVIRPDSLGNPAALARFRQEIQAVDRLHHPHIALAYHAEQTARGLCLAMEYCAGPDLARLVEQAGPLPVARACDYARQAALGLHHAHEHGLVHRDIKPSNLLLDGATVKILDFGLARLRRAAEEERLTSPGAVMGTPDFLTPEQARDAAGVDSRADLYSLGCTLYYLLSGAVPFPGGTAMDKMRRHQVKEPTPVGRLLAGLPAGVGAAVRRLMRKDPADRYRTAAEVAAALESACPGEATAAPSAGCDPPTGVSPSFYPRAEAAARGPSMLPGTPPGERQGAPPSDKKREQPAGPWDSAPAPAQGRVDAAPALARRGRRGEHSHVGPGSHAGPVAGPGHARIHRRREVRARRREAPARRSPGGAFPWRGCTRCSPGRSRPAHRPDRPPRLLTDRPGRDRRGLR
jgi:serine/threonine protein kinase